LQATREFWERVPPRTWKDIAGVTMFELFASVVLALVDANRAATWFFACLSAPSAFMWGFHAFRTVREPPYASEQASMGETNVMVPGGAVIVASLIAAGLVIITTWAFIVDVNTLIKIVSCVTMAIAWLVFGAVQGKRSPGIVPRSGP
jgi:hypothetical protein